MSNHIENIHVSTSISVDGPGHAWVTVGRRNPRRYSACWSRAYYRVTAASLARAQRAQVKMAGKGVGHG